MTVGLALLLGLGGTTLTGLTVLGTLGLCAAKDAHDAEYGLGRHHDEVCARVSRRLQRAPAAKPTTLTARLRRLLVRPATSH